MLALLEGNLILTVWGGECKFYGGVSSIHFNAWDKNLKCDIFFLYKELLVFSNISTMVLAEQYFMKSSIWYFFVFNNLNLNWIGFFILKQRWQCQNCEHNDISDSRTHNYWHVEEFCRSQ